MMERISKKFESNGNTASVVAASVLMLALTAGCASSAYTSTLGDVPDNTQLAISPNGSRLLVSWNDSSRQLHAKLVELKGGDVAAVRDFSLPKNTLTTAFSKDDNQLLITTWDKKISELLNMNIKKDNSLLIYESKYLIRFPLEVSDGSYVFLEGVDGENRSNQWQRYQQGEKTLLNRKNYNMASPINVVGDALFLLEPWSPPAFRNVYGNLPTGLGSLINSKTFSIVCADKDPLICLRKHIYTDENGSYFGLMDIVNESRRCDIAGRWIDSREVKISRDGGTVVFHAAVKDRKGPRAIYLVKNSSVPTLSHQDIVSP